MRALYKDFSMFYFYNHNAEEAITTEQQAEDAMINWIIATMKINTRIELEVSRSVDSGYTAGIIVQRLGRMFNINLSTDLDTHLIITLTNKPKEATK